MEGLVQRARAAMNLLLLGTLLLGWSTLSSKPIDVLEEVSTLVKNIWADRVDLEAFLPKPSKKVGKFLGTLAANQFPGGPYSTGLEKHLLAASLPREATFAELQQALNELRSLKLPFVEERVPSAVAVPLLVIALSMVLFYVSALSRTIASRMEVDGPTKAVDWIFLLHGWDGWLIGHAWIFAPGVVTIIATLLGRIGPWIGYPFALIALASAFWVAWRVRRLRAAYFRLDWPS